MGLRHAKCLSPIRLDGKTAIVTGCNTGIGKIVVLDFYKRGARVIMACRNIEKANEAAEDIKVKCKNEEHLGEIVVTELDLCSLDSVRKCALRLLETEERIDLLINNAGVMMCPQSKTKEGFETQFGTNHLGHFLFTLMLLPRLIKSSPSRIVNVSSAAYRRGRIDFDDLNFEKKSYSALGAYANSKLSNILFSKELASRLQESQVQSVTVYSLHPGVITTDLGRHLDNTIFKGFRFLWGMLFKPFMKSPEQGAQTTIHCAVSEEAGKETGLFYAECKVEKLKDMANNKEDAIKLWESSVKLVQLEETYNPFVPK
ncbi:hypothetical protein FQA39_LY00814 [Lamprigera yunnana]|nr:hypothetical protein FQA39_LY00814 [Lamprigera yunnana]